MSGGEADKRSKLEQAFASLWRRMRGEDQKVGEFYKPFPIFYEPPPSQRRRSSGSWIRPHGRAGNFWDRPRHAAAAENQH
jgi:hypothetical protein